MGPWSQLSELSENVFQMQYQCQNPDCRRTFASQEAFSNHQYVNEACFEAGPGLDVPRAFQGAVDISSAQPPLGSNSSHQRVGSTAARGGHAGEPRATQSGRYGLLVLASLEQTFLTCHLSRSVADQRLTISRLPDIPTTLPTFHLHIMIQPTYLPMRPGPS